jgi:hypothetical protein
VRDTHNKEDRKPGWKIIAERDDSGRSEQHGKGLLVRAEPICQARNDRPGDQSDSCPRGQHRADLRGAKPALMQKRGQEWGCDPERCEHRAVEK